MLRLSLTIFLFVAASAWAQTPTRPNPPPAPSATPALSPPAKTGIDALDAADLQKAIRLIREHYVNPTALNETELDRATLEGLLERLGRGVTLLPARSAPTPTPAPFYREIFDGHIGYLRPGDLSRPQLQELDTTLRAFAGKKVDAIILDLRGCGETRDYAAAAEFANRFVAKDVPLFSLHGPAKEKPRTFVSNQKPAYAGLIVVLVDHATAGASEVLAGVLRHYDKAIVIGETTAGRAVDYDELPLPGGQILRVATAEAILPEQGSHFQQGVVPDLPVALPEKEKRQIFQESLTKGMAPFVFEVDRPHLNEAALLSGTNPEIDATQAAQRRRAQGEKAAPHDAVLQRAVDLVTSIGVYEKQPGRSP
ncbi:MAG TPA: S41 family peptidase [Chthoniobacterales bacterium]|jgi:hypothetical protein|nr:S41 family peptidase [Chthoniobacterales bacterium]